MRSRPHPNLDRFNEPTAAKRRRVFQLSNRIKLGNTLIADHTANVPLMSDKRLSTGRAWADGEKN
jgi:hypothetical protein